MKATQHSKQQLALKQLEAETRQMLRKINRQLAWDSWLLDRFMTFFRRVFKHKKIEELLVFYNQNFMFINDPKKRRYLQGVAYQKAKTITWEHRLSKLYQSSLRSYFKQAIAHRLQEVRSTRHPKKN